VQTPEIRTHAAKQTEREFYATAQQKTLAGLSDAGQTSVQATHRTTTIAGGVLASIESAILANRVPPHHLRRSLLRLIEREFNRRLC
jgi:hypothetical protein